MSVRVASDEPLSPQQQVQEDEYRFPYHYLDLEVARERLIMTVPTRSRLRLVREKLGDVRGLRILDAGCGDGRFCYDMVDSGAHLTGVDYSERAIRFAQAFVPSAQFRVADVADLITEEPYDAAVLIETLEHIPPEHCETFVRNLAGVIRAGGTLIVTVPSVTLPVGAKHYRHFDEELLRSVLSPSFEIDEVSGYGVIRPFALSLRKRMAKLAYPFRKTSGPLSKWVNEYFDWYHRTLGQGSPAESSGLIAVCRRRE